MLKHNYRVNIAVLLLLFVSTLGCQNNKTKLSVDSINSEKETIDEVSIATDLNKNVGIDTILKKARDAWAIGKKELAQAYYIKAYESQPNNVEILKEMANIYNKLDNNELLEVCYKLILEQQPNNQKITEDYGLFLIRQKKFLEADKLLKQALDHTQNWKVYNGLGIIADIQDKHEEARFFYGKASLIQQENSEILNNIGYSFYMEDQLEKAQGYFLWAIKVDKGFNKAYYNYALTLARQKKYIESLSAFSKVMSLSEANNNNGYIAMRNGDYKKAEFFLNQAIKLSPTFYKKAHQNLQELHLLKRK